MNGKLLPKNNFKLIKTLSYIFVLIMSLTFSTIIAANPQGGRVVGGSASISNPSPNVVQVKQNSHRAIINWQSFNVLPNEHVNFQQPSASSIILNRINPGNGMSRINGFISANGQVWLINPAGIWFGPSAFVNVSGLLATTAGIRDHDFMTGHYHFIQDPSWNGSVVNEGTIIVHGAGLAALVSPTVVNNGKIEANLGTVVLASGTEYTIDFTGDSLIQFAIGKASTQPGKVINNGSIIAKGGKVALLAQTASQVLDNTINMNGIVQVNSVRTKNGEIILDAGNGKTTVTGQLSATGKRGRETGGQIEVLGNQVILEGNASIDVSGNAGGGKVLIGGSPHGAGPLPNANQTFVGSNVSINASALKNGNGGNVNIWSNQDTAFYGNIFAKGGSLSGNGGFMEVSGGHLGFHGNADASAPHGNFGTLLLDPKFVIVQTGGAATLATVSSFTNDPTGTDTIDPVNINNVAANVTLQANSDILVNTAIAMTSSGRTLTLDAGRSILLNANLSTTNGAITLFANDNAAVSANRSTTSTGNPTGDNETTAGNITMASGTSINAGTQAISLTIGTTATAPFTPGSMTLYGLTAGANSTITSAGGISINGAINTGANTLTMAANTAAGSGNNVVFNSGGSITTTNTTNNAVAINVNAAGGGNGGVQLNNTSATNITTGSGGKISIATNTGGNSTGGSITESGTNNVLSNGTGAVTLAVPTASTSSIGITSSPILTTSTGTFTLTAGSGGAFINNTGSMTLAAPTLNANSPLTVTSTGVLTLPNTALSTGTGSIDLESNGGALTTANTLTTSSGNIKLIASGLLTVNNNLTTGSGTSSGITLTGGTGLTVASNITINAGAGTASPGNITFNSGSGTFTLNKDLLLAGNTAGTAGTISITTNGISFTTGANAPQIGGTASGTGFANFVIVQPSTATTSIGIAGGAGTLALTAANLNTIRSTNVRIGNSSDTGAMTINAWTPAANFAANGVLTLETGGNITQGGVISLATDAAGLILRSGTGSGSITLTQANVLTNIAVAMASTEGLVSITNAANSALTVASLVDDIGAVVGITSPGGITLANSGTAAININNGINTSGNNGAVSVTSGSGGISAANGVALNAGSGTITMNAGAGPISLGTSTLSTSNATANAIKLTNATTVALGNISATGIGATLTLGTTANITGAVTQVAATNIAANILTASTNNSVTLNNSGNTIANLAAMTTNGALNVTDSASLLTVTGNVSSTNNPITLSGVGYTQNASTTVNAGTNSLNISSGTGTLTLNSASNLLSTATITLTDDLAAWNAAAQIGGSGAGTGSASFVIIKPSTAGTTIGIAGGTGSLQLTAAMLNDIRSTNVHIGSSGAGTITSAAWTPAANFAANGVLTLDSGASIAESGAISLATSGSSLLLRNASSVNLSTLSNVFNKIAATNIGGSLAITNASGNSLTVSSLTDNVGAVSGVTATGTVTLVAPSAAITLNNAITAGGSGTTIVLAGNQFVNNVGVSALVPGSGNSFQVWSGNPANDTRGGLTYNFKQYNAIFGVTTVLGTGNGFLYTLAPVVQPILQGTVTKTYNGTTAATLTAANYAAGVTGVVDGDTVVLNNPLTGTYPSKNVGSNLNITLTGLTVSSATNGSATVYGYQTASPTNTIGSITPASITVSSNAGQSKVYGSNDPVSAKTAYSVTSGTLFSTDTLTGNMGRVAGENVGSYNFTQNTVAISDGNGGNNYTLTFNGSTNKFQILALALSASMANQNKIYGANDPAISGIGVNLANVVNTSVTDINGNVTAINDTAKVATSISSLTRAVGETVGNYNVTGVTFNALTGSSAGNYTLANAFSSTPTLTINPAALTANIANQTKIYGNNDPALSGIGVTLNGIINNSNISTWNGTVSINDTGKVATTLASLTRNVGETVASYNITAASFNALSGTSAGNYSVPTFSGTPNLSITTAPLTATLPNQTKVYGNSDPLLAGITVTLNGIINNSNISTWNGIVSINDIGKVATTLSLLTRAAGENVGSYNVTAATFNVLTGLSAGNYSAPSLSGTPTLSITPASTLTASIANQTKVYGSNDPALSGISVNLSGQIVNPLVVTWNGIVSINDVGKVAASLASLTRAVGENVGSYNITAATFNALTGTSGGNYNAPTFTGIPNLSITPTSLTGSIANQTKVYGSNDPALSGISVNLNGIINNSNISTWNGTVAVNDTGKVATTLASLTRAVGETVASYNISAASFNALTGTSAGNYNAPTFTGTPTLSITPASLTASIANQSKIYGNNDPLLSGIGVTLNGIINNSNISTWDGTVSINDTGKVATTLASLTRAAGENVASYNVTAATFNALTGVSAGNYSAPTLSGTPTLSITPASLTGSIINQTKVYGSNDPVLSGIAVTLNGIINNANISTWNGTVSINDTGKVATTLASLTRAVGETVASYNITAAAFNALTGTSAGNYSVPTFTGIPTLSITPASLTGSIANQSKVYGSNDPTLSGIAVTLNGIINNANISTWNGTVSINDTGKVATTLASLTRNVGENVGNYNITAAAFNALTGLSAGNYSAPTFTGTPTLNITPASLTGSITNQSKVYGSNDPALSGIAVTLNGIINNSNISTWNGTVAINDAGKVATTLASLTRNVGENVGSYNITAAAFNALTGVSAGNYNAPSFIGTPILSITPASLTGSIANQSKVYGSNDPALSGIGVTLNGINNNNISTWNGIVSINDTGKVATTLASLTRNVGENVGNYNVTAAVFNALTGVSAGNYSSPTLSGTPILNITPASLTSSIANQTKVYGSNDPALSGIGVTLNGIINNNNISTWNGTVSINDTGKVATTLASLSRDVGENVGNYNVDAATFNALTGVSAGNYSVPTLSGGPTLSITPASLTGSIANQSKIYGSNDPALSGIAVTLNVIINNNNISTWNGIVSINDTGKVATTLASLSRDVGENVGNYNVDAATFNALTGVSAGNYNAPSFTGTPILSITPASLTASIANQTKVYGSNDPALSGIAVILNGIIDSNNISTWNGIVSINDTGKVATTLASLTRNAGENIGNYNVTAATFNALTGVSAGNYSAPTLSGAPTLNITPASLTGSIVNQSKVYGSNDPALSGIAVTLNGIINNNNINTWNGIVSINDTGKVATTLASLSRDVGENVGNYNVDAATFNTLTGVSAGNYNAPSFTGTPILSITPASLTASITNQTKVYGSNDPALSGIAVTLNGIINNNNINTWNAIVSINDTGKVATTLASLSRDVGENVGNYNVDTAIFNALTGISAGNYNAPNFTGTPILSITPASLTGSIANQIKVYGNNDPALSGITVNLNGIIDNANISTWNGTVSINDTGKVATTLASLSRDVGENVGNYNVDAATFNALTGTSAANYNVPSFIGTPILSITPASLTGSIANQTKVYGSNDPAFSGIAVNLNGIINNNNISTWNGIVSINDTGKVATTLASLSRDVGENVGNYNVDAATFNALTGVSAANYNAPSFIGTPILSITPASLTSSIANQTKVYGSNDPTLSSIAVTLNGIINNNNISTWNGIVSINDTGKVATTLASLTRDIGENVGNYNVNAAIFNALTGVSAGNYNAPSFIGAPILSIIPASLTGSIANQTKVYGSNDPTLSSIAVNLNGIINNNNISTWNGIVSINDTGKVATTLASLTRDVGENVGNYNITAAIFNALTGVSAGNYSAPSFAGTPILNITPASLTGSIVNQTKVYGSNDPALSGIAVTLNGIINNANIVTWNGIVAINDTGKVAASLASLSRDVGENVGNYHVTAAIFNALTGVSAGNYNAPILNGSATLAITPASLTGSVANQTKVYGNNDPALSSMNVLLNGVIDNANISTWNGIVAINDTNKVASSLASLTRTVGENVGSYNITAAIFNVLTGPSAGNYNAPLFSGTPILNITSAPLTSTIANQTKVYGNNDPAISSIGMILNGIVNNNNIMTWDGVVAINDIGKVATSLAGLTRAVGENVGNYAISSALFTPLTGSSAGNYSLPTLSGTPQLNITPASTLVANIANQTKIYGSNDPALSSINVNLTGLINNANVSTWNGIVAIDDVGKVISTVASLARIVGENVGSYNVTNVALNPLAGPSGANYTGAVYSGLPVLSITPASLTATIPNLTKVAGSSDPALSGIPVTLNGVINATINTWNGAVVINDVGKVSTTLASLTRVAGETVGRFPITNATFNPLTGSAASNFSIPILTGSPALIITPALNASIIANQVKVYGTNALFNPFNLISPNTNIVLINQVNTNLNETGLLKLNEVLNAFKNAVVKSLAKNVAYKNKVFQKHIEDVANIANKTFNPAILPQAFSGAIINKKNVVPASLFAGALGFVLISILSHLGGLLGIPVYHLPGMSFKLRTSFNNIMGLANMIQNGSLGQVTELQKELMNDVLSSTNNLVSYLHNMENAGLGGHYSAANISFNLRTDLNNIMGFTNMMESGQLGHISEIQKNYLNDLLSESKNLMSWLNSIEGK